MAETGECARQAMALVASDAEGAQAAEAMLRARYPFVSVEEADLIVALGGDGFLLQTLHDMLLDKGVLRPVFGMNRGTVGFLMNEWRVDGLAQRVARARAFSVAPLRMKAVTVAGEVIQHHAINEVSLLRETRQTAWVEVSVNGRVALTPISPFRPRRWRGALIPDELTIGFRVLDPTKRPVSAVADQLEVREVATVEVSVDTSCALTLLFDPEHALDERIAMEQFAV